MENSFSSARLSVEELNQLIDLEKDLDRSSRELLRIRDTLAAMRLRGAAASPAPLPATARPPLPPPALRPPPPVLQPPPPALRPPPPAVPARPWWQREGAVARVLSIVGSAVLLLGVSLLLVLAIQRGYFGPVPRVAAGTLAAVVLVVLGAVVHRQQPDNPGAVALAATGIAGGYLDVVAVTAIYAWVSLGVGLVAAAAVFAVGLVLARRWNSQVLAVIVVLGVALLAPGVGDDYPWVASAFLVLLSTGAMLMHRGHNWPLLRVVRVVPTALMLAASALAYLPGEVGAWAVTALSTGFALAVAVGELWWDRRKPGPVAPTLTGVAALPALIAPLECTAGTVTTIWLAVTGAAWVGVAMFVRGTALRAVLLAAAAAAFVLAFAATAVEGLLVPGILAVGIGYLAAAVGRPDRVVGWVGIGVCLLGVAGYLPILAPLLDIEDPDVLTAWDLLGSGLALGAVGLVHLFLRRTRPGLAVGWAIGVGAVGLLAVTAVTVTAGVLLGRALGDVAAGFVGGHAAATVVWMAGAAWLLLRSLRGDGRRALSTGVALAGLAVGKLLLFDLSTLDGLFRVAAFVVTGAVLLALGTVYARSFSASRQEAA